MAKTGRPKGSRSALTPEVMDKIVDAMQSGMPQNRAAALAGVGSSTITDAKKTDPKFYERLKAAEFHAELSWLRQLVASEKGWQRFAWLLERRFEHWKRTYNIESGEDVKELLHLLQGTQREAS